MLGAGWRLRRHPPARRRLQPTPDIKAKLLLCTLGYAERKIPSGEKSKPLPDVFDDRHGFPALQAGRLSQKLEAAFRFFICRGSQKSGKIFCGLKCFLYFYCC
jgi:hypothetical protein